MDIHDFRIFKFKYQWSSSSIARNMTTVLAIEYQVNSCVNNRIVIYLHHFEVPWNII